MTGIYIHECYPHLFPNPQEIYCAKQVILEENLVLPCNKPDIESLSDVHTNPFIEGHQLIKNPVGQKLFIEGRVEQEILYVANTPCQPVHAAHFVVPFCTFIDLPPSCISHFSNESFAPKILVEFIQAKMDGARTIRKCMILFIWCPIIHPVIPTPRPCSSGRRISCSKGKNGR